MLPMFIRRKSRWKQKRQLTNEEIIRELLDLLKKNTMKEQANDVFEICTYVDGSGKKRLCL